MAQILKSKALGVSSAPSPSSVDVVDTIDATSTNKAPSGRAISVRLAVLEQAIAALTASGGGLAGVSLAVAIATGALSVAPSGVPPPPAGPAAEQWSSAATWGGGPVPGVSVTGVDVSVAAGKRILLDVDVDINKLVIEAGGELVLDPSGALRTLRVHHIEHNGIIYAGTTATPFVGRLNVVFTGFTTFGAARGATHVENAPTANNAAANDDFGRHRSMLCMSGSTLQIITPEITEAVKLGDHVAAGATSMLLASVPVGWAVGQRLAIGTSSMYGNSFTEHLVITSLSGNEVGFAKTSIDGVVVAGGITHARWGKMQYVVGNGVSLTNDAITEASLTGHPQPMTRAAAAAKMAATVVARAQYGKWIDERATVINLSRPVNFMSDVDDPSWTGPNKDGGHLMAMSGAIVDLRRLAFVRMGQRGLFGRYPFHAHNYSIAPDGVTYIPPATSKANLLVVDGCVVLNSANRAFVIHNTIGSTWQRNVAVGVLGHAFFSEDGAEINNVITDNHAMAVSDPGAAFRLKDSDETATGFWYANARNYIERNTASDCQIGQWVATTNLMLGFAANFTFVGVPGITPGSKPSAMEPIGLSLLRDCVGHGNALEQIHTGEGPTNNQGTRGYVAYRPTVDGVPNSLVLRFTIKGLTVWKASVVGYQNRIGLAFYDDLTISSHWGHGAQGATSDGSEMRRLLCVGFTLNNPTERASDSPLIRVGVAAYHWTVNAIDPVFVNYVPTDVVVQNDYRNGGFEHPIADASAIGIWDSYLYPVQWGHERNSGAVFVNALPMYLIPPNHIQHEAPYSWPLWTGRSGAQWTLSGALRDHSGWLDPAGATGKWWARDRPFFVAGQAKTPAIGSGLPHGGNGVLVDTPFYGIELHETDTVEGRFNIKWAVTRFDSLTTFNSIDNWTIPIQGGSQFLANMRHTALAKGGVFLVETSSPVGGNVSKNIMLVNGMASAADFIYVGFEFSDSVTPRVVGSLKASNYNAGWQKTLTVAQMQALNEHGHQLRVFTEVASFAALEAATTSSFFRHLGANKVWVKAFGGYTGPFSGNGSYASGAAGQWDPNMFKPDTDQGEYTEVAHLSQPFYLGVTAVI